MAADDLLTPIQRDDLHPIAGRIIPASVEYDVPGADDPAIQADILATLGRDAGHAREAVALELRTKGGAAVATLTRVVRCNVTNRDDRVVRSLKLEPRLPLACGRTASAIVGSISVSSTANVVFGIYLSCPIGVELPCP